MSLCEDCIHYDKSVREHPCDDCFTTATGLIHFSPKGNTSEPHLVLPVPDSPQDALSTQVAGSHYKEFAIQPIEFAMVNSLNACQAKVVKYVCRKKGDLEKKLEDLDKAMHVIQLYKQLLVEGKVKS